MHIIGDKDKVGSFRLNNRDDIVVIEDDGKMKYTTSATPALDSSSTLIVNEL